MDYTGAYVFLHLVISSIIRVDGRVLEFHYKKGIFTREDDAKINSGVQSIALQNKVNFNEVAYCAKKYALKQTYECRKIISCGGLLACIFINFQILL
jgi:hypothetical protein